MAKKQPQQIEDSDLEKVEIPSEIATLYSKESLGIATLEDLQTIKQWEDENLGSIEVKHDA